MTQSIPTTFDGAPDKVEIAMVLRETGEQITEWLEYQFNEHFLTPTSAFSFTVGGIKFRDLFARGVRPGARCSLRVGSQFVADGYIDDVEMSADRNTGIIARIEGRDRFGYAVDAHPRPRNLFKEGDTLEEALKQIFAPLGFTKFVIDNDANRSLQTGLVSGTKMSSGGKKGPKPLKGFVLHQTKPYPGESIFAFASRICARHGLWLWLAADGETVVVSKPSYDQKPAHSITRVDGFSNVIAGSVKYSMGEQPTIIIADGVGGGGEFGTSPFRAKIVNPAVVTDDPEYLKIWFEYHNAKPVMMGDAGPSFVAHKCRALFLHDQSSQTQKQVENFAKREMALFLRKSLQATYTVIGHCQLIDGVYAPWAVDTMVKVDDDVAGLHETLWVVGRTFIRSRQGGTLTRLDLHRAHTLELGEAEAEQTSAKKPAKNEPIRLDARRRAPIEEQLTSIDSKRRQQKDSKVDKAPTEEEISALTQLKNTIRFR